MTTNTINNGQYQQRDIDCKFHCTLHFGTHSTMAPRLDGDPKVAPMDCRCRIVARLQNISDEKAITLSPMNKSTPFHAHTTSLKQCSMGMKDPCQSHYQLRSIKRNKFGAFLDTYTGL